MTETGHELSIIEHLDFEPACECVQWHERNGWGQEPATHWMRYSCTLGHRHSALVGDKCRAYASLCAVAQWVWPCRTCRTIVPTSTVVITPL